MPITVGSVQKIACAHLILISESEPSPVQYICKYSRIHSSTGFIHVLLQGFINHCPVSILLLLICILVITNVTCSFAKIIMISLNGIKNPKFWVSVTQRPNYKSENHWFESPVYDLTQESQSFLALVHLAVPMKAHSRI